MIPYLPLGSQVSPFWLPRSALMFAEHSKEQHAFAVSMSLFVFTLADRLALVFAS